MVLPKEAQRALNKAFHIAQENGITLICLAIDPVAEGSDLLFNPEQLDVEQARNIVETFVDCTRQELEDVNGSTEENLIH